MVSAEGPGDDVTAPGKPPPPPLRVKLALVVVALVLVAAIEVLLRLLGVGAGVDPLLGFGGGSIFVKVELPDGRAGFAVDPALSLEPFNAVSFAADKPEGGRRVFVLGGSAVYGYPRDARSSLSRWLEDRLRLELPGAQVEVINLGAMSYGSARLVDVAAQCLAHDPDLIILASGNNEYVERRVRADVREVGALRRALGHLRIYRVMARLLGGLIPRQRQAQSLRESAEVTRDVVRRTALVDQEVLAAYEANLTRMVSAAKEQGVGVLVSNVPTNLLDWAPQESAMARTHSDAELKEWLALRREGDLLLALDDPHAAIRAYDRAITIDGGHAGLRFAAGRARMKVGDVAAARDDLVAARDNDLRPIRATGAILARAARVASQQGVPFVNADAAFALASERGIPGNDMLVDYCHPDVDGHRLWAATLAGGLRVHGLLAPASEWRDAMIEILDAERAAVAQLPDDRATQAQEAMARGFQAAREERREDALAEYTHVIELDPSHYDAYYNRALQLLMLGRPADAAGDLRVAIRLRPDHYQARGMLGAALLDLGDSEGAREALEAALLIHPEHVRALVNLGKAYDFLGDPASAAAALDRALRVDPNDRGARLVRATFRANHGDRSGALQDVDRVLQQHPGDPDATHIREQLLR